MQCQRGNTAWFHFSAADILAINLLLNLHKKITANINPLLQTYHDTRKANTKEKYYLGLTLFGYSKKEKLEAVESLSEGKDLTKKQVAILNQGNLGKQLKPAVTAVYNNMKNKRINKLLTVLGYTKQSDGSYTRDQTSSYGLQKVAP